MPLTVGKVDRDVRRARRLRSSQVLRRARAWVAVAAVAALPTSLIGASAAAGATGGPSLPDEAQLEVVQVASRLATVKPGEQLEVGTRVANIGGARADGARLTFHLSKDDVPSSDDMRLAGSRRVPALGPGETWRGTTSVRIPAELDGAAGGPRSVGGSYSVIGCVGQPGAPTDDCQASPSVGVGTGPTRYGSTLTDTAACTQFNSLLFGHGQENANCEERRSANVPVPAGIGKEIFAAFDCPDPNFRYPLEGALSSNPVWTDHAGLNIVSGIKAVTATYDGTDFGGQPLSFAGNADHAGYVTVSFTNTWIFSFNSSIDFYCADTPANPI